jgi:hypothetical protein
MPPANRDEERLTGIEVEDKFVSITIKRMADEVRLLTIDLAENADAIIYKCLFARPGSSSLASGRGPVPG